MTNHLDQCVEVQYLLNITSLSPALFSDDNNIGSADNTNSYINSHYQDNWSFIEGDNENERNKANSK